MPDYDKAEISVVLHAAEILRKYQTRMQINVSQFCKQIGISRKNAYKHKGNIDIDNQRLEQQIEQLNHENARLKQRLKASEQKGNDADLYKQCLDILVAFNKDTKKKSRPGQ